MVRIAPMNTADLDAVMEIERISHPEPWSRKSFIEEMMQPVSRLLTARVPFSSPCVPFPFPVREGMRVASTALEQGCPVGYICFWLVVDEIQILNVAVHPAWRRRGIGRLLLHRALEEGWKNNARVALLEVRPGNGTARRLYEALGFRTSGLRPNYYGKDGEPALLMDLPIDEYRRLHLDREIDVPDSKGITQ